MVQKALCNINPQAHSEIFVDKDVSKIQLDKKCTTRNAREQQIICGGKIKKKKNNTSIAFYLMPYTDKNKHINLK